RAAYASTLARWASRLIPRSACLSVLTRKYATVLVGIGTLYRPCYTAATAADYRVNQDPALASPRAPAVTLSSRIAWPDQRRTGRGSCWRCLCSEAKGFSSSSSCPVSASQRHSLLSTTRR